MEHTLSLNTGFIRVNPCLPVDRTGIMNANQTWGKYLKHRASRLTEEEEKNLNILAYGKLREALMDYGNKPSVKQEVTLSRVVKLYTRLASGEEQGRHVVSLPTGYGKSESLCAWMSALHELKLGHIGVMICCSKVEELAILKRKLIEYYGVNEDDIALVHSYRFDENVRTKYLYGDGDLPVGYASEPSNDDCYQKKQFLFVTHQRIRGSNDISKFINRSGHPREFTAWDESFLVSDCFGVFDCELKYDVVGQEALHEYRMDTKPILRKAIDYLYVCHRVIKDEMQRQREMKSAPEPLYFEKLSSEILESYKRCFIGTDYAYNFLSISQEECRVLTEIEGGGAGLLTYKIVIPPEMKNLVILDASTPIRKLVHYDKSVTRVYVGENLVSYEDVVIKHIPYKSSKSHMKNEFLNNRTSRAVREVVELVKSIPESESILIWVFKDKKKVKYRASLISALERAGINTDATVQIKQGRRVITRKRINILTWGQETALNSYSHCQHNIFPTVLRRTHADIGAWIAGQQDDLFAVISNAEVKEVLRSEMAHCLYQAMSRGSSRQIVGDKAKPMTVYLMLYDVYVRDLLEDVMPNLKWEEWKTKYITPHNKAPKVKPLADKLKDFLSELQEDKMSTRRLKQELELEAVPKMTFTKALRKALEDSVWMLQGRSVVRLFA